MKFQRFAQSSQNRPWAAKRKARKKSRGFRAKLHCVVGRRASPLPGSLPVPEVTRGVPGWRSRAAPLGAGKEAVEGAAEMLRAEESLGLPRRLGVVERAEKLAAFPKPHQ